MGAVPAAALRCLPDLLCSRQTAMQNSLQDQTEAEETRASAVCTRKGSLDNNPNGGTLHHLMGNFSLDQTLKSVCNHRTKGCAVHPLGPHLPCTYGRRLPIGNVMTTFLTNLGALGRATAG